jgi:hypothetical protein
MAARASLSTNRQAVAVPRVVNYVFYEPSVLAFRQA